jgi:uncharacterized hydrophobic protein (TIGR00271 family)
VRLVTISIPDSQRDAIIEELRDRGLGYTVTSGEADQADTTYISFVVPADAVEHVLDDLVELGYDRETFTVSIETDFANFEGRDEVQDYWANTPNKIAPRALRSKAKDMRYNTRAYLWMMILSAVVAVAGLLLASPAVVVGSMVLAPIVSPMLTASVGAVRRDHGMLVESLRIQVLGLAVAVLAATAFSFLVKEFFPVPTTLAVVNLELVSLRMSPGMLSVAVGLAAGAAGAFGLATKGQVSIVGVMIAAALIPTAGAAGIGIAWGQFGVGVGAIVLLFITVTAVNVGAFLMLTYLGYRTEASAVESIATRSAKDLLLLAGTLVAVVAIVAFVGVGFYQQAAFEREANSAATDVLQEPAYDGVSITESTYEYTGVGPFTEPTNATYTLARTSDDADADLPTALAERIGERTGENVTVDVQYVDYYSSKGTRSGATRNVADLRASPRFTGARYSG